MFTKVVTLFALSGVSADVFVTAINNGVETSEEEVVVEVDDDDVRDMTDFTDPFTKVDIFVVSRFKTLCEVSPRDAALHSCLATESPGDALDTLSSFSTFTTGFEETEDTVVAVVVAVMILFPDLTDLMGLIFMLTPRMGAETFFTDTGTCFKLPFVDIGLKVPLTCRSLEVELVLVCEEVKHFVGSGISSFFPSSELSAEAGMFPKLLRFVEP